MNKFLDLDGVKSLWSAVKTALSKKVDDGDYKKSMSGFGQALARKQDALGVKSDGDAKKYLNEQGQFTVPEGSVAVVTTIERDGVYIVDEKGNIAAFVGPDSDNVVNTIGYKEINLF